MDNRYTVFKDNLPHTKVPVELELYICETSNTLKLCLDIDSVIEIISITPNLPPEELMKIFLEGIKVCSYSMTAEEFNKTLSTLENYSI